MRNHANEIEIGIMLLTLIGVAGVYAEYEVTRDGQCYGTVAVGPRFAESNHCGRVRKWVDVNAATAYLVECGPEQ